MPEQTTVEPTIKSKCVTKPPLKNSVLLKLTIEESNNPDYFSQFIVIFYSLCFISTFRAVAFISFSIPSHLSDIASWSEEREGERVE